MIKSVAAEHHWTPEQIGVLSISGVYEDNDDMESIEYWYNHIVEMHKELDKKKNNGIGI
jgi:hypothetical protein